MMRSNLRFRAVAILLLTAVAAAAAPVPTPESWFGHRMGADRTLVPWNKVASYFQELPKFSDRIRVETLGPTTMGRPFLAATIAAPETLKNLPKYLSIQQRLASGSLTQAEADKLIPDGKTIVLVTCSIHSTETASTHSAIEFAYNLLTKDTPKVRAILDNTILILVPSLNPDGVDIVRDWYMKTLGTKFEGTSPPELYHKYVGHDNNRDWYIFSQAETRMTVSKLHNVWHPQIVYDVHQQGAFASRMFLPPWLDPVDPNVDPILMQLSNAYGLTMASDLTATGRKGVTVNSLYDFWTPARHYQSYHGGIRLLSESASVRIASPITVGASQISRSGLGYNPQERSWNYLEPWLGGDWHLRDIVDDQLITMESCLYQAAFRREDMLRAFWRVNYRAAHRTSPYAFVISATQRDPGATKVLLDTLHFGDVRIDRASAPFTAGGNQYPAGSYVVKMQQPYSPFAKTLLEKQDYPDLRMYPGGPPRRPYDVTAQTLPLLMGVDVDTVPAAFSANLARATDFAPAKPAGVLPAADTDSWRAVNQAWKSGSDVYRDPQSGDFHLSAAAGARKLRKPRVGLYKAYTPSMDEGWTRWIIENIGFDYKTVYAKEIQAGDLNSKFDVIIFPEMSASNIQNGQAPGTMPEEYVGGLGEKGTGALKQFASRGGTVVFLNDSSEWAIHHLGLTSVKNVLSSVSNRDFYCPGSLLNVTRPDSHPLLLGMPKDFTVWFESGPAFEITPGGRDVAVASYVDGKVLASGWLLGEKYLQKRAAVVDSPVGSGHVILFGIRPQYRAQSYLTFKMLFNSMLYYE